MGFLCLTITIGAGAVFCLQTTTMAVLKKVMVLFFEYTFAILALIRLAISFIFNPSIFKKVERSAPSCLTDKSYGEHNYVKTASNIKFHYVSKGEEDKPLMLFVHGFPEFWYSWRNQLTGLQDVAYRMVALDLRGYGDSDKPEGLCHYKTNLLVKDIKEFIEALGYSSCILVAHDWGGILAWRFAHEYSHMVNKLIVLNAPHPIIFKEFAATSKEQKKKSWYVAFFQVPYIPELFMTVKDMNALESSFRKSPMGLRKKELMTDEDMEAFKYTFGKPGAFTPPVNYYRNSMSKYEPLGSWKSKIPCPVMVIWGTSDGALVEGNLEGLDQYIDDLTIRKIIGASHWVQQDEPALVNNYIKDFIIQH
ncbi:Epoxide hydrolase 1 [Exaiptasia diaphana]|nr:Epoxide hydrolase 1 [Exaiptasia diaphana]